MTNTRLSTGVPGLDPLLGGGLLPGTLTVVVGATGIGKTQLGVQFAAAGREADGRPGVFFDMSARGDSQSHAEYAQRIASWQLRRMDSTVNPDLNDFFQRSAELGDYLHVFDYRGQRVTKSDLDFDQWRAWQSELNHKLRAAIAFLYGNFVAGCRRVVLDGIEPADRPNESIQFNLIEYVYHQVLRKEPEWVARDLFRESYRANADAIARHAYDPAAISGLLLSTSHEIMLDDLVARPLNEGDAISNANTLIYMGKIKQNGKFGRALYVAKHRGSACSDEVIPYTIDENGLQIETT